MRYLIVIGCFISTFATANTIDSLHIKIGQMILIGLQSNGSQPDEALLKAVTSGKVGGVIIYEKNVPETDSYMQLKRLIWNLQDASKIPLFITIDQEGGKVNRLKSKYGFPPSRSAYYLGSVQDLDSTRFYSEMTAATLAGLGINVNFAPDVDVIVNPDNPVIAQLERSYSASPDSVAIHAATVIATHRRYKILTVLKHFPGHGSSFEDTHKGMADVTNSWKEFELLPYHHLIQVGFADAVMTAHIVNRKIDRSGLPATLSTAIVKNLLRDKLSYNGLVFSDDMQMKAITAHYGIEEAIELAINAGVDVLIFSNNISGSSNATATKVHGIIESLVKAGKITPERIDESYRRIMQVKKRW